MNVLVSVSEFGYSIHDQNKNIKPLQAIKKLNEALRDSYPVKIENAIKFIVIPDGLVTQREGESFLQALHRFCPDCSNLEAKIIENLNS